MWNGQNRRGNGVVMVKNHTHKRLGTSFDDHNHALGVT